MEEHVKKLMANVVQSKDKTIGPIGFRKLIGVTVGVFIFVAVVWLIATTFPESVEVGKRFDAVNALFSGFAFVSLVAAVMLQRDELILQRQELKDTRVELHAQATALLAAAEINALKLMIDECSQAIVRARPPLGDLSAARKIEERHAKRSEYMDRLEKIMDRMATELAALESRDCDLGSG